MVTDKAVKVFTKTYNNYLLKEMAVLICFVICFIYNTAGQLLETQHYQGSTKLSTTSIIWLGATPIAQLTVEEGLSAQLVYLHADHLNTPRKATNELGQLVWQWQSDAFGHGLPNEDVELTTIDLRFPGQIYDAESGLYYNYYRYYDPKLGRYITSDPIGLRGGINTFAYVGGNPVGLVDPLGLYVWGANFGGGVTIFHVNIAASLSIEPKDRTSIPF